MRGETTSVQKIISGLNDGSIDGDDDSQNEGVWMGGGTEPCFFHAAFVGRV